MKIGFYIGGLTASDGGVFTLENTLLDALSEYSGRHEIHIFSARSNRTITCGKHKITQVPDSPHESRVNKLISKLTFRQSRHFEDNSLNAAAIDSKIDLMWFVNGYRTVQFPYVMTVQDLQHRKQPYFPEVNTYGWKWHEREKFFDNAKRASYLISGSEEGKRDIEFFLQIPAERIHVLPLPTPLDALSSYEKELPLSSAHNIKKPYLFYPAQFWSHKNHITLLKALEIVNKNRDEKLTLVLTGSEKGNLKYILESIENLGMSNQVRFLGTVSREDVLSLYKNASALVFPSLFGPDNIPPLEAFALGCPVIIADLDGARNYLGDSAMYFDPLNESALAACIEKLLADPKISESMRQKGRLRAQSFTSREYLKGIIEIADKFEKIRRCWK